MFSGLKQALKRSLSLRQKLALKRLYAGATRRLTGGKRAPNEKPGVDGHQRAMDTSLPSVLFIDDRVPTPDRDAGSARVKLILSSLVKWCHPVFVSTSRSPWPEYEPQLQEMGIETRTADEYPRLVRERGFAAAIVSRPDVAEAVMPVLRRCDPRLKIIFDLVDVSFLRVEREYQLKGHPHLAKEAANLKRVELDAARAADLTWCASTGDQQVMNELVPGTPSVVIPTIHPLRYHDKQFEDREGLFFLGNMSHTPNADSVRYLTEHVMPLVRHDLPDVVLYVAGAGMTAEVEAFAAENVRILGYVPDLDQLFADCRVMVAPLRFGAGINGKIGESMANGLPVVTTSIGATGFGIQSENEAMIGDTPEQLAAAIVRLYLDPELWERLATNGRRLIEAGFTPEAVEKIINSSIRDLTGQPDTRT